MKKVVLMIAVFLTVSISNTSCTKENDLPPATQQSGEGGEGSGGEGGNESGQKWNKDDTADETVNGIRAIIHFDATSEAFVGTFENTNTTVAPKTRLEVHVFDANGVSTEFGPTTPIDMQAGETRNVSLSVAPGISFIQFAMHPEVGSGEGGDK